MKILERLLKIISFIPVMIILSIGNFILGIPYWILTGKMGIFNTAMDLFLKWIFAK